MERFRDPPHHSPIQWEGGMHNKKVIILQISVFLWHLRRGLMVFSFLFFLKNRCFICIPPLWLQRKRKILKKSQIENFSIFCVFLHFFDRITGANQLFHFFLNTKKWQMLMGKSTLQKRKSFDFCILDGTEVFKIAKKQKIQKRFLRKSLKQHFL